MLFTQVQLWKPLKAYTALQGHWVKGIIDELQLDELGKVRIVEHKTRRRSSVPSDAQKETARLQVCTPPDVTYTFCSISTNFGS